MEVLFKDVDFDLEITFGIVLIGYSKLLFELKSLLLLSFEKTDKLSELAFRFLEQTQNLALLTSFSIFCFSSLKDQCKRSDLLLGFSCVCSNKLF